jgi:glucose/arabinose dehydrogenase
MRRPRIQALTVVFALALGLVQGGASQAAVPPDFSDQLVATVASPTGFAFTPDGRMLITTQPGRVRVVQGGSLLVTPALDISAITCSNSERGLLGIAVDPAFTSNGYVYLYYTFKKSGVCTTNDSTAPVNRVSRFVMSGNTLASENVLIDNIHSPNGNHNAGDLNFGKDGFLYVTVGDGGCDYAGGGCAGSNDAARDRNVLIGKVLRITRDGGIPAGNPFTGAGTARCNVTGSTSAGNICQETFAWGLRNPFRFAFDPNAAGTVFHINDVGQNAWEEIDLGASGADYGWNIREGFCATGSTTNCGPPPVQPTGPLTNPIFAYGRSDGCVSITGGAFVPNGVWPAAYNGQYLFSDYGCGKIFRLVPNGSGGFNRVDFATGLGGSSAVHLRFGPHGGGQALYYSTYAGGGQIRRIAYTPANTPPIASVTANPTSGGVPLTVSFDGSASSDPDGNTPLTYEWAFGDGATATTSSSTTSHQYTSAGNYTASLVVRDSLGLASPPDTVSIQVGNTPPSPTITAPAQGVRYRVGQTVTLTGNASDAEEGTLPPSRLTWTVLIHHADHTHPWFGPASGNNLTFTTPAPEDLAATNNSYLEIILTATDSGGASTTVTRNMQPKKVSITFTTGPTGLKVIVNGVTLTGPTTITSWQGYVLNVTAPTPQGQYRFYKWSDGGARSHAIKTPSTATTYKATFRRSSPI